MQPTTSSRRTARSVARQTRLCRADEHGRRMQPARMIRFATIAAEARLALLGHPRARSPSCSPPRCGSDSATTACARCSCSTWSNITGLFGHVDVIGMASLRHLLEVPFGPLDAQPLASQIYGLYTGLVYLTPLLGGLPGRRGVLGHRRMVVIGALLMALGHFMMAFEPLLLFALLTLVLGNGAFKPNMSALSRRPLCAKGDAAARPRLPRSSTLVSISARSLRHWCAAHLGGEGRVALRIRGRRRRHADRARDLSGRRAGAAARPDHAHGRARPADARRPAHDRRPAGAVRAHELVLGDLRAAGQHPCAVGRRADRPHDPPVRLVRRDSDHVVPGVQPVHDFRLYAVRHHAVEAAGRAPHRAVDDHEDGVRLLRRDAGEPDHGSGGAACR